MKPEQIKAERERFETVLRDMESMSRDKGISDERAAGYYDAAKLVQEALDASPEPARAEPVMWSISPWSPSAKQHIAPVHLTVFRFERDAEQFAAACKGEVKPLVVPLYAAPPCPAVTLPTISEDEYEQILEAATRSYRKSNSGYQGQQITVWNSFDWHIVQETRRWLDQSPEGGRSDAS
jgi:hypothetical protein